VPLGFKLRQVQSAAFVCRDTMHRECRPEDLHHIERSAPLAPGGGVDDHDRALFGFTALLPLLIGRDFFLGLLGWCRLPLGLSLSLRHLKIKEIAILTGDREPVARAVARRVHADPVQAELLPADKAHWIAERKQAGRRVAMVGDGINDAPALAQAEAGVALGGVGADLAAEAGDMIVMGDPLRVLPDRLLLSRKTIAVIRQNIIGFAFGLNAVAVLSATFGILGPVAAAILHQVGSLLVLLNSMRLRAFGDWWELPPLKQVRALGASVSRLDDGIEFEDSWRWVWSRRRFITGCVFALLTLG
jgi:P-type Cu+ transporter